MTEEEKEQEEISHRDDDMESEDLVATDFDDEADSYEEEKSTDSTGIPCLFFMLWYLFIILNTVFLIAI